MRIRVQRARPRGEWTWEFPGTAEDLAAEWRAGSAPFHLMNPRPQLRGKPRGTVTKGATPEPVDATMHVGDGLSTFLELEGRRLSFPQFDASLPPPVSPRPASAASVPERKRPPEAASVLGRLDRALAAAAPAVRLNPGAHDAELASFERVTGLALPEDVRACYRAHDGQADLPGAFFGLRWMPLADAAKAAGQMRALAAAPFDGPWSSTPTDYIALGHARAGWVPFAEDFGGVFLAIDLEPGPRGTRGQVISCGRGEHHKVVVARSLLELVERVATELESGNVATEGGHPRLAATPVHFVDAAKMLAARWLEESAGW